MTGVRYLGPKSQLANLHAQERRASNRFRVHDLIIALRRRFRTQVRIDEDHRQSIPGGLVILRLGMSPSSPLVIVRTIPRSKHDSGCEMDDVRSKSDGFLVYSAAFEYCPEVRALNRLTVEALTQALAGSHPKVAEQIQEEDRQAA